MSLNNSFLNSKYSSNSISNDSVVNLNLEGSLIEFTSLDNALYVLSEGCIIDGKYLKTSSSLLKLTKNLRSEEHTSELQSRFDLVCRLLLEKKNYKMYYL